MAKKLFNYDVPNQVHISENIIDGTSTGIIDPNSSKYNYYKIYKQMIACRWTPEEVDVTQDAIDIKFLLPAENRMYSLVIAGLIFMDSIQTNNTADNVNGWITEPTANACITLQAAEEALHSDSYYLMTDTVFEDSQSIYDMWKYDPVLRSRNEHIGNIYESYGPIANETDEDLEYRTECEWSLYTSGIGVMSPTYRQASVEKCKEIISKNGTIDDYKKYNYTSRFIARVLMIIANQCLEGIYFNSGFLCVYLLGRSGKMLGSVDDIRFIHRDELNHMALFINIFKDIHKENSHLFTPALYDMIRQLYIDSALKEIEWGIYITQNQIIGIDNDTLAFYIKYLANDRFSASGLHKVEGLQKPFPEVDGIPESLKWISSYKEPNNTKTNFFEGKVKNYDQSGLDTKSTHKFPMSLENLLK